MRSRPRSVNFGGAYRASRWSPLAVPGPLGLHQEQVQSSLIQDCVNVPGDASRPAPAGVILTGMGRSPDSTSRAVPEPFSPGAISSSDREEYRITFTPDGLTAYFSRAKSFFPVSRSSSIYESHLTRGTWSEPVVASFSETFPDIDPWMSPDGQRLYFSSIRPVGGEDRVGLDVWFVPRHADGSWGCARPAGEVNSTGSIASGDPADELYPSIGPDGWLYVGSNRDGGARWLEHLASATKR